MLDRPKIDPAVLARFAAIVGEPEADPNKKRISVSSPLARALIGKARGSTVEVDAPGGARSYVVSKVEWRERGRNPA